ncbi:MAG: dicarboxylate/amino acid:cation symporter [Sphingobium sp.]|nr:dicarboxylate/amino acid:cation symporter [Sphingobium sp.]
MAASGSAGPFRSIASGVLSPMGQLWLDALTMTVVPLVFGLLATGIMSAAASGTASSAAGRSLIWFAACLTGACLAAALAAELILAWWPVHGIEAVAGSVTMPRPAAAEWYRGIIPANPIKAAADTAIVPLVVFALFFGFAAARIEPILSAALHTLLDAIVQTMLLIVQWVLKVAPIGIFALAFGAGSRMGSGALGMLGQYIALISAICLLTTLLAYVVAVVAGRISILNFTRAALPAQTIAFGTQSSLACLPVMVSAAPRLGVSPASAGLILPLAVSIFRAASAGANVAVAVYLAHLHAVPLSWPLLLTGALIAVPVSLAAVGLPAQVSFFATIGPVCLAMGVPVELLPLLLAVETVPDIFRTVGNVTADLAVTRLAGDHAELDTFASGRQSH